MAYDAGEVDLHAAIKVRNDRRRAGGQDHRRRASCCARSCADGGPRACSTTPFELINKVMDKKALGELIDQVYLRLGNKATVILADRLRTLGYQLRDQGRRLDRRRRHADPARQGRSWSRRQRAGQEIEKQFLEGLITDGERYNKVIDIWAEAPPSEGREMMLDDSARSCIRGQSRAELQPDLHDGRLRRPWFSAADPPAGRHARPDGQALGRDHRDADHGQLPRGPVGAAVLHLDPRRPQGAGGHRAQDGELRLPDAAFGGRGAGRDRHRGRLRHDFEGIEIGRSSRAARSSSRIGERILGRVALEDVRDPITGEVLVAPARRSTRRWRASSRTPASRR